MMNILNECQKVYNNNKRAREQKERSRFVVVVDVIVFGFYNFKDLNDCSLYG